VIRGVGPTSATCDGTDEVCVKLYKPPLPTPEVIEASFHAMVQHGFRVDAELVWTYSFTHWSGRKLLDLRWRLEDLGFVHSASTEAARTRDAESAPLVRLCVSEIRRHTPVSLHERLTDLSQLAIASDVDYEGWEASKLPH
jgi:regulator of ribonuclease activity B